MSIQDKIKMFNQLKIPTNTTNITNIKQSDKINPNNKEKDNNCQKIEENKTNHNANASKKENIKEKKKDIEKKERKESEINDIKDKGKEVKKRINCEISDKITEKMKSLELYFKLRNEGWSKCNTELPKAFEKTETINNLSKGFDKSKTIVIKKDETMLNLEIEQDAYEFNENNYKQRRYDKNNVENGKKFFKLRYIKNKLQNNVDNQEAKDAVSQPGHDKERILRKYNSDFIIIIEKSILSFNVKNYKESYEFLESSGIIKNVQMIRKKF